MAFRRARWSIVGIVLSAAALGCGGKPGDHPVPTVAIPNPAVDAGAAAGEAAPAPPKPLPFAEAVSENSPEDQLPPPDETLNRLSTGVVRFQVQKLWDRIAFTNAAGKKLAYSAILDTEFGPITIAFRSDIAPNHVRNFVALAQAGFYDGLLFERVIEQQGDGPDSKLELIEGGCPAGTGEPGIGHLGYWVYPEISDTVKHEPGTVGACQNGDEYTAGCRFYITLSSVRPWTGASRSSAK